MSNRELPSLCHPEKLRFSGELCSACYFRAKRSARAARVSTASANVSNFDANFANRELVPLTHDVEVLITQVVDKRLKELGLFPTLVAGEGEYAKELWARLNSSEQPKNENS